MIRRGEIAAVDHFTIIPNDWARDKRLTWKARGILAYLLSHREGWDTSINALIAESPEGRDAVRAGVNELITLGYLARGQGHVARGRFGRIDYTLTEPEPPRSGFPTTANPTSANRPTKKTIRKENHQRENQGYGPAGADALATERQIAYLLDLHLHGGGAITPEIADKFASLTIAEANAEIKDALAGLPRGSEYVGPYDLDSLTPKGREVAEARLIPGGRRGN